MKIACKETASIKYYNMEEVSVSGFCVFCRNNIPLVLAVSITLVFTYGIRLFWYSIGIDTELFMADKSSLLQFLMCLGRFGYVLLAKFLHIKEFNPFTAFFTCFCLIWFFTISWCYIIAIFSRDTGRNNKLIPFALVFMTMPVWAEQFYFLLQAAENALIISLCPYVIYLLYKGFLDGEKGKIICASILLVFLTSVYQAIVPLFCCGVFACFVLLQEHTDYETQVYRNLCLKLLITLIVSMAVYSIIDRAITPAIFHFEKSSYLDNMNRWGKEPFRIIINNILIYVYSFTIGYIPLVQNIVNPIIAAHARTGMRLVESINSMYMIKFGNPMLPIATILFICQIIAIMRKRIPVGRRFLYMLAGIGIPFCVILLTVIGGNVAPPARSLYALPLALAFMFFFLIRTYKKKAAIVVACFALFTAMYQAQITAQLFYSDQIRYNEDVRLAYELNDLITQVQPNNEKLPVTLIGRYQSVSRFQPNFLQGDELGRSFFNGEISNETTKRGLAFMNSLGIYYEGPNKKQMDIAREEAKLMPSYPDPGCVKRVDDFIVVRISETLYDR